MFLRKGKPKPRKVKNLKPFDTWWRFPVWATWDMIWVSVSIVAATSICLSAKIDPKRQVCISCHRRRKHDFALWISVFWKLYFPCFFSANLPLFPAKPTVLPQLDSNVIINYKSGPNARQVHININKSWRIRQNVKTDECWSYYKNPLVYPSEGKAVFVRLCGMIKHPERQTRTLFLPTNTTRSDMTHLRLPWQNAWEMQVHKYTKTNTTTQIQIYKHKYTNTTRSDMANLWQPWQNAWEIQF